MKKKFVKVSLFCALVATASVGFVACADYDDDIKNLQTQVDANKTLAETLDAQIQDLKKAQETANAEIQAAKDAAAAAQEAADKANELAKQAAAEAKAEAIEEATKLVEALKADIEAKNYATTEDLNAAINTVNTKIASVEDGLNKQIESINGTIDGLVVDVDKAEELIAELQTQKLAVETFEQYKKDAALEIDSLDEKIDSVKTELDKAIADAEQNAKDYTDQEIEKLKTDLEKQITAVNANLVTLLTQSLRSLVFVPNLFVDGIEAVEYDYLPYKPFKTFESTKSGEGDKGTDEGEAFEINGIYGDGGYTYDYKLNDEANTLYINPTIDVEYKMNPSSVSQASIEKMDWSILERDVEVVSRGAVAEKDQRIHVTKVAKSSSEAGSLVLSLWADGVKINSQSNEDLEAIEHESGDGENDATIFALQSKKAGDDETPDQIVTSDYAMLYASQLKLRAIAYSDGTTVTPVSDPDGNNTDCSLKNDPAAPTTELYEAPAHAIKNPASFQIQYNATDLANSTLKLKEKIQIHYDWISNTGKNGQCKIMSLQEAADKYGFKVKFNRVNYTVGSASKTADSQYLLMNEDGEVAVCAVNSDGTQNTIEKNPVDAIGRHPLVQVLLTKEVEEGGKMVEKVVLDGYIKIAIKREIKNKETDCFDLGNVAFGCGPVAKSVTWSQISAQLLREAAVTSREEFDALYRIETTSDGEIAQYVRDNEKYDAANEIFEYVQLSADKDQLVGKVTDEADEETGTSTTILTWTLENVCDMQQVYESTADEGERSGSLDHAKTIYVKYVPRVENPDATSEYPGIFLPLTIGVDKPQASVSERIDEYWYNDMDNWYGRYDGVHVNVQQPMDNSNTKQFVYNLYSAWVGNKITFSGCEDFTSYSASILKPLTYATSSNPGGHMFYFRPENENKEILGVDGKTYVLSVASTQVIKKCDGTSVSVAKGELTPEFEKENALVGKQGVYANNVLYARVKGTVASNNVKVAEIKQGIDEYTNAPTLIIDNNPTTKAILNTYAHDDAKSWTAFIGITAMSSPCDVTLSLTDNVYPARIQRPVDIEPVEGSVFTDAEENSSIVDLFDLFDYSDWRNVKFINGDDITKAWLFAYYGFKSATADIDGITTTMNGGVLGETLLSDVSKEVIFEQIDNEPMSFSNVTAANYLPIYNKVRSSFGKIKYDNNRGNVQNFKVRIPVDFEYEWGTIRVYVDCDVKNTMGND